MDTLVNTMRRRSPLLLAALLAQTAVATSPESTVSHAVAPQSSAAAALTLVRVEPGPFSTSDALVESMNACVAQIVARELDQAVATCDRAIGIARTERV